MKKSYLVTACICGIIAFLFAFTSPVEPLYKNLKVLPKNITKPEMDTLMRSFTRALGVKCDYCHVRNVGKEGFDFPNDKEEAKTTARGMLRMQAKINKKFFDVKDSKKLDAKLKVTCYTCHHGTATPLKKSSPRPATGTTAAAEGASGGVRREAAVGSREPSVGSREW